MCSDRRSAALCNRVRPSLYGRSFDSLKARCLRWAGSRKSVASGSSDTEVRSSVCYVRKMHGIRSRSQEPNIRAVILDYGEVLSHPPDRGAIAVMAGVLAVPVDRFLRLYGSHRYPYDRGDLSGEQYWSALAADAGVSLTSEQIDYLRRTDVAMWSNLNPVMLRWAGELRRSGVGRRCCRICIKTWWLSPVRNSSGWRISIAWYCLRS